MSEKIWSDDAWEEYLYWQCQDKKTIKRINVLIKDIDIILKASVRRRGLFTL